LLGPEYSLLRAEFQEVRSRLKARDGLVRRIFVFFGGSDLTNETEKALHGVALLGRNDIAIDVVVGSANPHQESIASLCAQLPDARLHRQINNMAELMARADVAIGAAGSTIWERCALALPAVAIAVADNQISIAEGADRSGAQIYLGRASEVTSGDIATKLSHLLGHPEVLLAMSSAGQRLVDANGTRRIIAAMGSAA
jgi:UDP-2,4-diacetamido-2,4,6-trideoxy-beta-L-altropyranose hydrolase